MLDGKKLGKEIWAKVKNLDPNEAEMIWEIIGDCICDHIKQNAVVKPGIDVTTPNGIGQTTGIGAIE